MTFVNFDIYIWEKEGLTRIDCLLDIALEYAFTSNVCIRL